LISTSDLCLAVRYSRGVDVAASADLTPVKEATMLIMAVEMEARTIHHDPANQDHRGLSLMRCDDMDDV
jgi:hypothetical protein